MAQPYYVYKEPEISVMLANDHRFLNFPSCQREFVWKLSMQQRLIDSILRGLPIPSLVAIEEQDVFGSIIKIVDGQQRVETIRRFANNQFPTATRSDEPRLPLIEPGRYYRDLSSIARTAFDGYQLRFSIMKNVSEYDIGLVFRRLQNSEKLNFAEILFSYDSETGHVAKIVQEHPFFEDIWPGQINRKQLFMMGLLILLLESSDGPCNLTTERMKTLASGTRAKDEGIDTTDMSTSILRRLSGLSVVFQGITIHQTSEMIPIYEASMMLENAGFDLLRSKPGCLTAWYMNIKEIFLENRRRSITDMNSFVKLTNKYKQIEFWKDYLDTLMACDGLFRKDSKRTFDLLDKVKLWNKQGGMCPNCNAQVRIEDIGHHKQQHSDGGPTTISNGSLIHVECHKQVHQPKSKPRQHALAFA